MAEVSKDLLQDHKDRLKEDIEYALTSQKGATNSQGEATQLRESIQQGNFCTKPQQLRCMGGDCSYQNIHLSNFTSHAEFLQKALDYYVSISKQANYDRPRIEDNKHFLNENGIE